MPPWVAPAVLPAPSTAPAWRVTSPVFVPSTIDCVTATVCQAAGPNGLAASDDGGQTWTWEAAPGGEPTPLACVTVDRCWAVGDGYVDATTDGGARWAAAPLPGFRRHIPLVIAALACPSAGECVAVGTAGSTVPKGSRQAAYVARTDDGGRSWQAVTLPAGTPLLHSASCPTALRCLAVGGRRVLVSDDGGARWRQQRAPAPVGRLTSITCRTATWCVAVGTAAPHPAVDGANHPLAAVTGDGGRRWHVVTLPSALATPTQVACTAAGVCLVSGTYATATPTLARSTDRGRRWAPVAGPGPANGAAGHLDCPSADRCLDATGTGLFATDPMTGSWIDVSSPAAIPASGYDTLAAVSCPAPGHCTVASRFMALAGGGSAAPFPLALTTTDGGATWLPSSVDNGRTQAQPGLSCPTTSTCQIVDAADLYRSIDGGASWTRQPLPSPPGSAAAVSVSCPDVETCMAVGLGSQGMGVIATADAGSRWTSSTAPPGVGALTGVACTTGRTCVAVGTTAASPTSPATAAVAVTVDQGQTWQPAHVPAGTGPLAAVFCPNSEECVAVGGDRNATHPNGIILTSSDGGTTWAAAALPADTSTLDAVSCPSAQECVAVGDATAVETVDGGRRWTPMSLPAGVQALTGVSCTGDNRCVAVGLDRQGRGMIATMSAAPPT